MNRAAAKDVTTACFLAVLSYRMMVKIAPSHFLLYEQWRELLARRRYFGPDRLALHSPWVEHSTEVFGNRSQPLALILAATAALSRDECLNEHVFLSLAEARANIETWRDDYNYLTRVPTR